MTSVNTADVARALTVRPWPDPLLDHEGHDPRSLYVERFWLGILGPSATWLLRRIAAELEEHPAGFELDVADTARSLGLGLRVGRNAPMLRTVERCTLFGLARYDGDRTALAARRRLPWLSRNQVARLPTPLQVTHHQWVSSRGPAGRATAERARARRLALSLLELGDDLEAVERHLQRLRFYPECGRDAAAWAWDRHRQALAAAQAAVDDERAVRGA
jgi:hypothetical protein